MSFLSSRVSQSAVHVPLPATKSLEVLVKRQVPEFYHGPTESLGWEVGSETRDFIFLRSTPNWVLKSPAAKR